MCVLSDWGGCGIILMGWNSRLGVWGQVYAPAFRLFGMYARLYVSLGCIHGFWSVYLRFHIHIWDIWCLSAITDVLLDYLTDFYDTFIPFGNRITNL